MIHRYFEDSCYSLRMQPTRQQSRRGVLPSPLLGYIVHQRASFSFPFSETPGTLLTSPTTAILGLPFFIAPTVILSIICFSWTDGPHNVLEMSHFQYLQGLYQNVWFHVLQNFFDFFLSTKDLTFFAIIIAQKHPFFFYLFFSHAPTSFSYVTINKINVSAIHVFVSLITLLSLFIYCLSLQLLQHTTRIILAGHQFQI